MKVETGCWRVNRLLFIWKFRRGLICSHAYFTAIKPFPTDHQIVRKLLKIYLNIF